MNDITRARLSARDARLLFDRLLAGDPTAPADLAVAYLDLLTSWLVEHNPLIHPHDCATAAEDAILALIKNPKTYKPELQTLEIYLRMSAAGDLKNLLRAEGRHSKRRAKFEDVELLAETGKYIQEDNAMLATDLQEREDRSAANTHPVPAAVRTGLTPEEARVLELMLMKERRTASYVVALSIADRPLEEQRRKVKRVKDRLKKRLQRAGGDDVQSNR